MTKDIITRAAPLRPENHLSNHSQAAMPRCDNHAAAENLDVRSWPKADISGARSDVRYWG